MPAAWEMIKAVPQNETPGSTSSGKQVIGRPTVIGQQARTSPVPPGAPVTKSVAVLIPHTGEVSSEWALMMREFPLPMGSQLFMSRGMPIDVTRESMVNAAMSAGFEWLFFIDSDVILPKDALQKLLQDNLPIVSGLYKAKKPNGFFWAAWMQGKDPSGADAFVPVDKWQGHLFEVDVIGTGCMLIHRKVIEEIKKKRPDLPLFFWTKERPDVVMDKFNLPMPLMKTVSEDFWFCMLARSCGFQVVADGDVKCGHISMVKVTEDTVTLPSV